MLELKIAHVGATDIYTLSGNHSVHDVRNHDVVHQFLKGVLQRN